MKIRTGLIYKILTASLFICFIMIMSACSSSSTRNGFGPYDFTDYNALDAQIDRREMSIELTMEAKYEDYRYEEYYRHEKESYADYLSDLMHERELREIEENGYDD